MLGRNPAVRFANEANAEAVDYALQGSFFDLSISCKYSELIFAHPIESQELFFGQRINVGDRSSPGRAL